MANVIKLHKGLDIHLQGKAEEQLIKLQSKGLYALVPDDFEGVTPKVVVKEGDKVKAGDALFVNKQYPEVKFASPVSGTVREVVRYINQLPYAVSTNPTIQPKAIFVSALRDKPLAGDFNFEVKGQEQDFQAGLTALSKIAKTYLGIGVGSVLEGMKDVEVNIFDGPCPAGNVGVQVNHVDPVNKGEVVWTIGDPTVVLFIGRLFNTGKVDLRRRVALCGSEVKTPAYVDMLVGEELSTLLSNSYDADHHVRIINGNVLTGRPTTKEGFLGAHTSEITVIPEGDQADEMLGWILPRFKQFSVNRSYFSWLQNPWFSANGYLR